MTKRHLRLGVNIDHVATIRNARGGGHPDPVRAADLAVRAGADGITAHLREDRRHISDDDIAALVETIPAPINLEMAATDEMVAIAVRHRPDAVCIVPERREERTTEGGIDVVASRDRLASVVRVLKQAGIEVTLFIEPAAAQIEAASAIEAFAVELTQALTATRLRASASAAATRSPPQRRWPSGWGSSAMPVTASPTRRSVRSLRSRRSSSSTSVISSLARRSSVASRRACSACAP